MLLYLIKYSTKQTVMPYLFSHSRDFVVYYQKREDGERNWIYDR